MNTCRTHLFPLWVLATLAIATAEPGPKERWVYAPANYQVNEQADRIIALMRRGNYEHLEDFARMLDEAGY